ncbi:MAG: LysR family transcriptional regulator [Hyphomonadaceae bacterium]|nr:LysR family transcriptional regulator [Hyphomonadaceae bacterium]
MPIGDIDELATFVHIVDHQGVSAAARALGRPKSSVSRKLAMLEDRLGARLLDRGVGGQRLTETGHTVYAHARRILQELDQIDNAARPDDPQGLLRISSTFALVDTVLRPILPKFL